MFILKYLIPGEKAIVRKEFDISNQPQLDQVNPIVQRRNLRSLRPTASALDYLVDIQPLVEDVVDGQGQMDREEDDEVPEDQVSVRRRRQDPDYKKLNKRMKWEVVPQTEETERCIPIYGGTIPFIVGPKDPIEYFRKFFDQELLQYICNQSNLYGMQQENETLLCLETKELEIFIGISLYMSLAKLPRSRYYWQSSIEMPAITEYMRMRRWETIKSNLHFANNADERPERGSPGYDKIWKMRPYLNMLNERFNQIPMGESLSFDEQIIPYSGTRGPRMYTKNKPNPWGFKVWALADTCGILYNFDLCVGATPQQDGFPELGSIGNTVIKGAQLIPHGLNHKLYMDNLFSGVPLFYELYNRGVYCMGTARLDRIPNIKSVMISDGGLKYLGRSAFEEYQGQMDKGENIIRVVRWNDNNIFTLMSTISSGYPPATVERWDKSSVPAKKITVGCPSMVKLYNTNMGGVDKMDALVGFYRTFFR